MSKQTTDEPVNADNHPIFEFVSARTTFLRRQLLLHETWPALSAKLAALEPDADPAFPGHPAEGPRGGEALAQANQLAATGGAQRLSYIWPRIRDNLPAALLALEDPSVSAVWPPTLRGSRRE